MTRKIFPCVILAIITVLAPFQVAGQFAGADTTEDTPIQTLDPSEWDASGAIVERDPAEELAEFNAAAPDPLSSTTEGLVYDWNGPVRSHLGRYVEGSTKWRPGPPVRMNFDWTKAPNFANGTYHVRVLVRSARIHDDFRIIFNHWQEAGGRVAELGLHVPEFKFSYRGAPITRTFSIPVQKMVSNHTWDSRFLPFDWAKPRQLIGFLFPNHRGASAEVRLAPAAAPVDMRVTVVVTAPGATFSGWQNY
jgi:hypothetical protein